MNVSLLLDLYELTMLAAYQRQEMIDKPAVFDLFFRENPFRGGYAVFAGLEPALDYLEKLRFDGADIEYIRGLGLFETRFLDYLASFRFRGRVTAAEEGTIVFGGEPLVSVEGGLGEAQIVETALLNLINYQTLVATKAARIALAAGDKRVVEFGARRAQGPDGALGASRAAHVGGAAATSHLRAGRAFGIPVAGTQAHSFIMAFPSELEAFQAFAASFPDRCILLVDTYDTLRSGLPNAITVARELKSRGKTLAGVRLDSGDLAYLSREARRLLDEAGLREVEVFASNELDESIIESIRREGGAIDAFGVGTRLVTGAGEGGGALGGVYKLVDIDGEARIKVSSERTKSTLPGRKRLWRAERAGRLVLDVISREDESPRPGDAVFDPANPMRHARLPRDAGLADLRAVVMEEGRRTRPPPELDSIAARAREQLGRLPEGCTRLLNPHIYRVSMTRGLRDLRERMIEEAVPNEDPPKRRLGPERPA